MSCPDAIQKFFFLWFNETLSFRGAHQSWMKARPFNIHGAFTANPTKSLQQEPCLAARFSGTSRELQREREVEKERERKSERERETARDAETERDKDTA